MAIMITAIAHPANCAAAEKNPKFPSHVPDSRLNWNPSSQAHVPLNSAFHGHGAWNNHIFWVFKSFWFSKFGIGNYNFRGKILYIHLLSWCWIHSHYIQDEGQARSSPGHFGKPIHQCVHTDPIHHSHNLSLRIEMV